MISFLGDFGRCQARRIFIRIGSREIIWQNFQASSIRLYLFDGLSSFCCPCVGIKTLLRCKVLSWTIRFIVLSNFVALTEKIKANGVLHFSFKSQFWQEAEWNIEFKNRFFCKKMKEAVTKNLSNCDSRRSPQWSRVWNLSLLNWPEVVACGSKTILLITVLYCPGTKYLKI